MANRLPYYSMSGHVSLAAKFAHKVPVFLVLSCTHSVGPLLAFDFTHNPRTKFIARLPEKSITIQTRRIGVGIWHDIWCLQLLTVLVCCVCLTCRKIQTFARYCSCVGWSVFAIFSNLFLLFCAISFFTGVSVSRGVDPVSTLGGGQMGICRYAHWWCVWGEILELRQWMQKQVLSMTLTSTLVAQILQPLPDVGMHWK